MPPISSLDEHPNRSEILEVVARSTSLGPDQVSALASHWVATGPVSAARSAALDPDAPLVVDVLRLQEEVRSEMAFYLGGHSDLVSADSAVLALKAVFDAIAAAFAQPVLTAKQHQALLAPWAAAIPLQRTGD